VLRPNIDMLLAQSTRLKSLMLAACAALAISWPCAYSGSRTYGSPQALLPVLEAGFTVVRKFPAQSGLQGWVLRDPSGGEEIVYSTHDGKLLLDGILMNSKGDNLTHLYAKMYESAPNINRLYSALQKTYWVTEGPLKSAHQIWVVMDPNCIFCNRLWHKLQPYEKAGLSVHWIPIAILRRSSEGRAAAILKGGARALYLMESRFDVAAERGGLAGVSMTPRLTHELSVNMRFATAAGIQGTPSVFYFEHGRFHLHQGLPSVRLLQHFYP